MPGAQNSSGSKGSDFGRIARPMWKLLLIIARKSLALRLRYQTINNSRTVIVYFNGKFLPKEEVAISPQDRGFLLGDGVYEVIRSYRGHLFKCAEPLARLDHGL